MIWKRKRQQDGMPPGAEADETGGRPAPDDGRKPESPVELTRSSWWHIAKRTVREFSADQCTDLAAALTFYSVLAVFPAIVALVSIPAVFGQGQQTTDELLRVLDDLLPESTMDQLRGPLEELTQASGAGLALIFGVILAVWSASGYVGAFSRAMNRIYEVDEGRPFWKLRPVQLVVTVATLLLVLAAAVILVVSGPVARAIGDYLGIGDTALTVWNIAKWPMLAAVVVVIVAILYYATPNVRQPRFRWISMGAVIAIVTWALVSVGFGFYVANFSSFDKTYGSLAGVIVFLLWLWLTNLALLFGAEFDAETERARELQAGMAAEENIQLPPRDTRVIDKAAAKEAEIIKQARELREAQGNETPER